MTGAAGFLGTALLARLAASGTEVLGVDVREPKGELPSGARFLRADLLEFRALASAFEGVAPDGVVFHLAALNHVGDCRRDPGRAAALNVTGTLNVLEACRAAGISRVVYPSTALVYRSEGSALLDEETPVAATSVYGATKLAAEHLLAGHAAEFGFACSVARLGNVYGPGSHGDSVVSILVHQARRGGPLAIRQAHPVRDFIHRDDVCDGLVALAELRDPGFRVANLASGTGTSIRDLGFLLCRVAGLPESIQETDPIEGTDRRVLSIARMAQWCGWRPAHSLEAGLRATLHAEE